MRRERSAFFILFVWVLLMALGTTIAYFLWTILPDRNAVSSLKALQAMQVLFLFILPALAVAWIFQEKPAQWLGLTTFLAPKVWLYAFLLMLVMVPGINLLSYWNQQLSLPACLSGVEEQMKLLEEKSAELLRQFMNTTSFAGFLVNLGLMALLPAIGEELTFRGVLLHTLTTRTQNREPRTSPRHLGNGDYLLVRAFSVLRFRTAHADGSPARLYALLDRQSVDSDADALYEQCHRDHTILHLPTRGI